MDKKRIDRLDRTNDITIDEVRKLETFKNWSDERIEHLIRVIKTFTEIAYHNFSRERRLDEKNEDDKS